MTRLVIVFFLLAGGFTWAMQYVGYRFVPYLRFGLIGITPVTLPLFVLLAYFITWPIEKWIASRYIKKAKNKLNKQYDSFVKKYNKKWLFKISARMMGLDSSVFRPAYLPASSV